jgi:predicted dehydrogenase
MVGGDTASVARGLVLVVVAAPVWWWHWLHQGVGATRDTLWHAYVLLVAIFGGLVTAVVRAGSCSGPRSSG